jgi:hypothetical protein
VRAGGDDEAMNQLRSPAAQLDQAHPRKRDVATRWRKLLEDQRASGLPVMAFCRERGIPASSLFAWRRKLMLAGGEAASFAGAEPFKPVTLVTEAATQHDDNGGGAEARIEVWLPRERRLMVRRGFDRQLLADVIRTLESLA